MESNLVIVESPAKAKTIQRFLGNDYIVKTSFGHIRDLQENALSVDIDNGFAPQYVVPAGKKRVVTELKKLADEAQVVWLASDEDREGEAISWHLADTLGIDPSKTRRIAFHEITQGAIEEAMRNPRNIDMDMVGAQQARRVLDRLVGFQLSPVLWRKIRRGLSAGRVQSVALRLIVDREREINSFKTSSSYRVEAILTAGGSKVKAVLDKTFGTIEEARAFLESCRGATLTVENIEKKEANRHPSAPFTTSTLQQEASRKLHYPVRTTMNLAQALYERGLITYMRTDSTNLASLAVNTAKQFIVENFGQEYSHPRQYKTRSMGAQEAHEAIRPTFINNTTIEGTAQEQKLYNLIWKRTVASQMEEARVLNTNIKVGISGREEKFAIKASEVLFQGFLKLYFEGQDDTDPDDDEDVILPVLNIGDILGLQSASAECKFAQPPYRYSQATLIKKLEELGIGRPSTYATIIDTLTRGRNYVVQGDKEGQKVAVQNLSLTTSGIRVVNKTETIGAEKGKLLPQDIGMSVTDYLVDHFSGILEYDFTAKVESDFDRIAKGELVWNSVIADFYAPFHSQVDAVMSDGEFSRVEREIGIDPSDGQMITARLGQYGAFVQKGEGEARQYANLAKGQIIESLTLEDALKLLAFPRNLGQYNGTNVLVSKGRFGPYLKYGDKNISLSRGMDPASVRLEDCTALIDRALSENTETSGVIREFEGSGISVLQGRYGPYIKHEGKNYRIPRGTNPASLDEEACRKIIDESPASSGGRTRRFSRNRK